MGLSSTATRSLATASSKRRLMNNAAPIAQELITACARGLSRKAMLACSIARSVWPAHSLRKLLACQPRVVRVEGESAIDERRHRIAVLAETGKGKGGVSQDARVASRHPQGTTRIVDCLLSVRVPIRSATVADEVWPMKLPEQAPVRNRDRDRSPPRSP